MQSILFFTVVCPFSWKGLAIGIGRRYKELVINSYANITLGDAYDLICNKACFFLCYNLKVLRRVVRHSGTWYLTSASFSTALEAAENISSMLVSPLDSLNCSLNAVTNLPRCAYPPWTVDMISAQFVARKRMYCFSICVSIPPASIVKAALLVSVGSEETIASTVAGGSSAWSTSSNSRER